MNYTITVTNAQELAATLAQAPEMLAQVNAMAVNQSLQTLKQSIQELAPKDTGAMAESFTIDSATASDTVISGSVYSASPVALWQDQGTGIYGPTGTPITPKTAPYLVFKTKDGHWVRTKSARGVQPHYFMQGAIDANLTVIQSIFELAIEHVIAAIAGEGTL